MGAELGHGRAAPRVQRVDLQLHHERAFLIEAAGRESVRFCYYNHRGMYQRAPLVLSQPEIEALRTALRGTPALLALLRRLVE